MGIDEKELSKSSDEDLRRLLASGIRGKDYKLVMAEYRRRGSRRGLFDG